MGGGDGEGEGREGDMRKGEVVLRPAMSGCRNQSHLGDSAIYPCWSHCHKGQQRGVDRVCLED